MSAKRRVEVALPDRFAWEVEIEESPLGLRWWRHGGTGPWDKVEGTLYGQTRCVPLDHIDLPWGGTGLLCAMEVDRSFRVVSTHSIFPILDGEGQDPAAAAHFAAGVINGAAVQPDLFA